MIRRRTKPPRYVTLISKNYGHASIVRLAGEGPKNYKGYPICQEDTGEDTEEKEIYLYEKTHYQLIEGKHWVVHEAISRARAAYADAREEYDRARERAPWEFRDTWRAEHPYPVAKPIEEILWECGVTCGDWKRG